MTYSKGYYDLVGQLTALYQDEGEARSVARILFEDQFGINYPDGAGYFEGMALEQFECAVSRLLRGEPIQYVTGKAYFYGDAFKVSPAVLIPRPETEELVEWAITWLSFRESAGAPVRVLDIGTGSGCIAIEIKKQLPHTEVFALDVSPAALEVARGNAESFDVPLHFLELDILKPGNWKELPQVDLIISNPPYVLESDRQEMAQRVLDYEPELALFVPDTDPLRFYRALGQLASCTLLPGGALLVECHAAYAHPVADFWKANGHAKAVVREDFYGNPRMVYATGFQGVD